MDRNRLYRSDCKVIAEQLKREGIQADLIYLDPPFNSNRTYSMIFNNRGITAQQKAYHDMWDFTDRTRQLVMDFRDELHGWDLPAAFKSFMRAWLNVLESGSSDDRRLLNYLVYMTQRLIRLRDLLKPTGSIYFHCDPTASHYIKVIMDGVFDRDNFRNEIVWQRTTAHSDSKRWGAVADTILYYGVSQNVTWNAPRGEYDESYLDSKYRYNDNDGRGIYRRDNITSPNPRPNMTYEWKGHQPPAYGWRYSRETMAELDADGRIWYPDAKSKRPQLKRYLSEMPGPLVNSIWTDISPINSQARERLGYATQKPLELLERIIAASSNPGDLVLDPFCGCGTTIEAAQRLGRAWIGVDISGDAVDEIKDRMAKLGVYDDEHYDLLEGTPDTVAEYKRLNPFEKQDWLIRKLDGLPNPRRSGDLGIDGDLTFHAGGQDAESDRWGKLIFSVKTGKQRKPEHVRELIGTMKAQDAVIGVLILDADPTLGMEQAAERAGRLEYQSRPDLPPKTYDCVQLITAYEIIDGAKIDRPPSMHDVRRYREAQMKMQI